MLHNNYVSRMARPTRTAPRSALRRVRALLLTAWLLIAAASAQHGTLEGVSILPAIFRGSGCRKLDEVTVFTAFGDAAGILRVGFTTQFTASTVGAGRYVRLTCNGVIPIALDPGKRIGITQMRVGGHVALESPTSTALVTTEYFFPGDTGPMTQRRFMAREGTHRFGLEEPSATIWSKCGGRVILRINTALTASGKATVVVLVDGDADEEAPDGILYEVHVRDCIADPRSEL